MGKYLSFSIKNIKRCVFIGVVVLLLKPAQIRHFGLVFYNNPTTDNNLFTRVELNSRSAHVLVDDDDELVNRIQSPFLSPPLLQGEEGLPITRAIGFHPHQKALPFLVKNFLDKQSAMIQSPDLVLYACVAKSNTILAEFPCDSDVRDLGTRCIECTPEFHSVFSHTCRNRAHTFLIDRPFVFFGIFDESAAKSERVGFLDRIKALFLGLVEGGVVVDAENLDRYVLQREFEEIIRGLVPPASSASSPPSPVGVGDRNPGSNSDKGTGTFMAPLVGSPSKGLKKRGNGEYAATNGEANHHKDGSFENRMEFCDEMSCSRDSGSATVTKSSGDRQRVKRAWRRQLWMVLMLDLFFCLVLFVVWLWFCRGFQCIKG